MKKLSIFLLALVAGAGTMFASDISVDGIWYNFDDEHLTAEVTYRGAYHDSYWDEYSGAVVIPSSVIYNAQTYSVTSIGSYAFADCSGLTSVTIPNSVTSIGTYAFAWCSGLTSVEIPNSVTSIGERAFEECSGLISINVDFFHPKYSSEDGVLFNKDKTTIVLYPNGKQGTYAIPYGVTSIGERAFEYCNGLTSVTIPNSVTCIGKEAFGVCVNLFEVKIPNSVTIIGEKAFAYCDNLTSVSIPTGISIIGEWTFRHCQSLTSIEIPDGVESIGVYAFSECTGLSSISIPNSVTSIGNSAFSQCTGLTSVEIPNSVTSIGNSAFASCTSLTSVTIPGSVTSIGYSTFYGCSSLTSVTIPNSVTSIGDRAFEYCTGLTSVTNYATTPQTIDSYVFKNVDKSTCVLNVPKESVSLYQAAEVWKEFTNIVGVNVPIETIEGDYTIYYVDKESYDLSDEVVTLHVPVAPTITGFTFVEWRASGTLADGITLQAVYQADAPTSAPAVYTNPANPAQKLIKNGNVYILTDDKTYTITGQQVR